MATKQSALLSNRPSLTAAGSFSDVGVNGANIRVKAGNVVLETGDLDQFDIVMLCGLPSGATVLQLWIANDDLDANVTPTLAGSLGLWAKPTDTGIPLATPYAVGSTQFQGPAVFTDLAFDARDQADVGQKVWEDVGAAEDPNTEYFLGVRWTTAPATAQAGDLSFYVVYAID